MQELGYRQQLRRGLGVFSTFSIGVATVAPVVGLYAIFGLGMNLSGPVWVWLLVLSLVGQVLVAVVYSELASEFPIAGGPYQWVRRLIGPDAGIFTGLIYLVAVRSPPWRSLRRRGSRSCSVFSPRRAGTCCFRSAFCSLPCWSMPAASRSFAWR
ncbi:MULTISPECIES: amino acid permease [unclassified Mesorhizobium]|uniref:amino acid permease n=1 Tax=unclassified Mesorhizobium TaxID=325217 RepID=UPI001AEC7C06|nr:MULTISPECIES: amino acid permease [unclassified Mesorhizobium]